MENVIGNVRTIDRLELEYLQRIFNYLPEGGVADEDLPPPLHTREMKEFGFKDTKVLEFWLQGGQEAEFRSENLTMIGMGFQLGGRGKTAYLGYQDYFEQELMTYNLVFMRGVFSWNRLTVGQHFLGRITQINSNTKRSFGEKVGEVLPSISYRSRCVSKKGHLE
jgi:hypothetical protein